MFVGEQGSGADTGRQAGDEIVARPAVRLAGPAKLVADGSRDHLLDDLALRVRHAALPEGEGVMRMLSRFVAIHVEASRGARASDSDRADRPESTLSVPARHCAGHDIDRYRRFTAWLECSADELHIL